MMVDDNNINFVYTEKQIRKSFYFLNSEKLVQKITQGIFFFQKMTSLRGFFQRKPYRGFGNLTLGKHEIIKFSLIPNRFAVNVIDNSNVKKTIVKVELEDHVVYLPNYIGERFQEDQKKIDVINNSGINFYLDFHGKKITRDG